MPYIGKQPLTGAYQLCDTITTSATATYNLLVGGSAVIPGSANNCIVSLNGVVQAPVGAFTVSGSTITFASTLSATDVIDFILILGNVFDIGKPTDGSVTNASVASNAAIALSKLATTGTMTFASTIGVGGATPAASGAGITFPASVSASSDANTLDDYEEGTWTPVITSSSAPTVVYDVQEGFYTKIGRNVVLSARIKTTTVSGGSGSVSLSGVPFTAASSADPYENGGKIFAGVSNFTGEAPIDVRIVSTNAFLYYRASVTDGETNLQVSDLKTTAGNGFSFSINLRV